MEVILLERVHKLGEIGDQVQVLSGYARNYLLPTRKALRATKDNIALFAEQRHQIEAENLQLREQAEAVAQRMKGLRVLLLRAASETGQLYGSVTARDIQESVCEAGFTVERKQVIIDRPVKHCGVFAIEIRLHPERSATVLVNVARSSEESKQQQQLYDQEHGHINAGNEDKGIADANTTDETINSDANPPDPKMAQAGDDTKTADHSDHSSRPNAE
ncbi:MAG: 50S ribosomal protein L9 [Pseudomonadota bacterium]